MSSKGGKEEGVAVGAAYRTSCDGSTLKGPSANHETRSHSLAGERTKGSGHPQYRAPQQAQEEVFNMGTTTVEELGSCHGGNNMVTDGSAGFIRTIPRAMERSRQKTTLKSLDCERRAKQEKLNLRGDSPLPNDSDVLFGRGKKHRSHPGNKKMQHLVGLYREKYDRADRQRKFLITTEIVNTIKASGPGGSRFLRFNKIQNTWIEVSKEEARQKVSHAMRDRRTKPTESSKKSLRCDSLRSLDIPPNSSVMSPPSPTPFEMLVPFPVLPTAERPQREDVAFPPPYNEPCINDTKTVSSVAHTSETTTVGEEVVVYPV